MNILAIDTATRQGSIALLCDEDVLAETRLDLTITHAEKLLPAVAALLKKTDWDFSKIGGLALTIGPGSFTGLRIGLATMKGFAQAHELPLVGISSLEALAYNAREATKPVVAVLDARRGELYTAIYQFSDGRISKILLEEQAIKPELLTKTLEKLGAHRRVDETIGIQAGWVGRLAIPRLEKGEGRDWQRLTPNYLRSSDAEKQKA